MNRLISQILWGLVFISLLFLSFEGWGANSIVRKAVVYYVNSEFGSDTNSCLSSGAGACKTIQTAIDLAGFGDRVFIEKGIHVPQVSITFRGKPLTLECENRLHTFIRPAPYIPAFTFSGAESFFSVVRGCTIQPTSAGAFSLNNGSAVTIEGNIISLSDHNSNWALSSWGAGSFIFRNNIVRGGSGIYADGGSDVSPIQIYNNTCIQCNTAFTTAGVANHVKMWNNLAYGVENGLAGCSALFPAQNNLVAMVNVSRWDAACAGGLEEDPRFIHDFMGRIEKADMHSVTVKGANWVRDEWKGEFFCNLSSVPYPRCFLVDSNTADTLYAYDGEGWVSNMSNPDDVLVITRLAYGSLSPAACNGNATYPPVDVYGNNFGCADVGAVAHAGEEGLDPDLKELFVAENGSDTGNCRDNKKPCASLVYAYSQSVKDDTVRVAPGDYSLPSTIQIAAKGVSITGAGTTGTNITRLVSQATTIFDCTSGVGSEASLSNFVLQMPWSRGAGVSVRGICHWDINHNVFSLMEGTAVTGWTGGVGTSMTNNIVVDAWTGAYGAYTAPFDVHRNTFIGGRSTYGNRQNNIIAFSSLDTCNASNPASQNDVYGTNSFYESGCSGNGNLALDPQFGGDTGFAEIIESKTLIDCGADWAPNQWKGFFLILNNHGFWIESNTQNSLTVATGRLDWYGKGGDSYLITNLAPCNEAVLSMGAVDNAECLQGKALTDKMVSGFQIVQEDGVSLCKLPDPICGNGKIEKGEECDDGNLSNNDTCTSACQVQTCTQEKCDGVDNDCDGFTDEGDAIDMKRFYYDADHDGYGDAGSAGLTGCQAMDGYIEQGGDCNDYDGTVHPNFTGPDTCDAKDNDCDGRVDEDYIPNPTMCGVGVCLNAGQRECVAGQLVDTCTANAPSAELCGNNTDDDCDGQTDEGFDVGDVCQTGVGACKADGHKVCSADGLSTTCDAVAGFAMEEQCGNQKDDNCDGAVDEGFEELAKDCSDGFGACAASGKMVCSPDGHSLVCNAAMKPAMPEVCDGVDNDCDSQIDNVAGAGDYCTAGEGQCWRDGVMACQGGALVCTAQAGEPVVEEGDLCGNYLDDDCDGVIDQNDDDCRALCPDGSRAVASVGGINQFVNINDGSAVAQVKRFVRLNEGDVQTFVGVGADSKVYSIDGVTHNVTQVLGVNSIPQDEKIIDAAFDSNNDVIVLTDQSDVYRIAGDQANFVVHIENASKLVSGKRSSYNALVSDIYSGTNSFKSINSSGIEDPEISSVEGAMGLVAYNPELPGYEGGVYEIGSAELSDDSYNAISDYSPESYPAYTISDSYNGISQIQSEVYVVTSDNFIDRLYGDNTVELIADMNGMGQLHDVATTGSEVYVAYGNRIARFYPGSGLTVTQNNADVQMTQVAQFDAGGVLRGLALDAQASEVYVASDAGVYSVDAYGFDKSFRKISDTIIDGNIQFVPSLCGGPDAVIEVPCAGGDVDEDGLCDESDNCKEVANADQADADGDGAGDLCDAACPNDAANDGDADGICGALDNCEEAANPDQADADGDGVGDVCDPPSCGNGVLEKEELCDDGNQTAGDGCNESCQIEECQTGNVEVCAVDAAKGVCLQGERVCVVGKWAQCVQTVTPSVEACDGVDNDCDGRADEDFALGDSCNIHNGEGCSEDGKYACSADGRSVECKVTEEVNKNECGVCGGTKISGLGNACSQTNEDGCKEEGSLVCNADGNGTQCQSNGPVFKNSCGVCGGATLTDV
ncbi:MAG TPA: hypothetical protein DDW49_07205, partial [Deltaproteobacteria bacterium]|nr:hypothetical protein [Deltaproteobacteria bacterium]